MRRRHFLSALAAAPFAASLSAHANPSGTGNRLLVLVYTHGGNDGYNTWVPFTNATYYGARPTLAVPRDAVLKLTDHHGFHPAMQSLVPVWEQRELAILQGIGLPDVTQQHFRDTEMAFTASDEGEYTNDGWATRALARLAPTAGVADAVAAAVEPQALKGVDSRSSEGISEMFRLMRGGDSVQEQQLAALEQIAANTGDQTDGDILGDF